MDLAIAGLNLFRKSFDDLRNVVEYSTLHN